MRDLKIPEDIMNIDELAAKFSSPEKIRFDPDWENVSKSTNFYLDNIGTFLQTYQSSIDENSRLHKLLQQEADSKNDVDVLFSEINKKLEVVNTLHTLSLILHGLNVVFIYFVILYLIK